MCQPMFELLTHAADHATHSRAAKVKLSWLAGYFGTYHTPERHEALIVCPRCYRYGSSLQGSTDDTYAERPATIVLHVTPTCAPNGTTNNVTALTGNTKLFNPCSSKTKTPSV